MARRGSICFALVNGVARKRAPCHIPEVSEVPEVSARPPFNGIPCGRPAHSQRQSLAGGPSTPSGNPLRAESGRKCAKPSGRKCAMPVAGKGEAR